MLKNTNIDINKFKNILGNTFSILNFEKKFNQRKNFFSFLKFFQKICIKNFLMKLKEKSKAIQEKEFMRNFSIDKITNTIKMHKKRKEINLFFNKLKLLQRNFKRFIWKKKILKIVKIQSLIRKK